MIYEILLYGGIGSIILGTVLYFVASYMVKYYDNRINKHIFEILRPKPRIKKWFIY